MAEYIAKGDNRFHSLLLENIAYFNEKSLGVSKNNILA
jgi:hypothetical protein